MKKALICLCLAVTGILVSPGAISYARQSTLSPRVAIQTQIDSRVPSIVREGFEALESNDVKAALSVWLEKSSPLLRSNLPLVSSTLQGVVKEAVGECVGYSAIETFSVTDNSRVIWVESQHEYGAHFWAFTTYKSPKGWIISDFSFNTDPSKVIPIGIMFRR